MVRESMVRTPARTRLLNGQETNCRLGSIRTTSIPGSSSRTYFAAVAPPQPPPITTTRGPDFGAKSPLVEAAQPARPPPASTPRPTPDVRRNPLRVTVLMALLLLGDGCVREFPVLGRERRESTSADATASSELHADRLLDPREHRLRRALQMPPTRP